MRRSNPKATLRISAYGCLEKARQLETILGRRPARLHLELEGIGQVPDDHALLLRSILRKRSPRTKLVTHARSSIRGGTVLLWLLGDQRKLREDAMMLFRAVGRFVPNDRARLAWRDSEWNSNDELDEANEIRVLELINEYLPVKELAGSAIDVATLREFGLVENRNVERFLKRAFRGEGKRVRKSLPAKGHKPVKGAAAAT